MAISLTKEKMEELFLQYLAKIFGFPEVVSCCAKEVVITRETLVDAGKQAFEEGYHDLYSDIDLSVKVRLPKNGAGVDVYSGKSYLQDHFQKRNAL